MTRDALMESVIEQAPKLTNKGKICYVVSNVVIHVTGFATSLWKHFFLLLFIPSKNQCLHFIDKVCFRKCIVGLFPRARTCHRFRVINSSSVVIFATVTVSQLFARLIYRRFDYYLSNLRWKQIVMMFWIF